MASSSRKLTQQTVNLIGLPEQACFVGYFDSATFCPDVPVDDVKWNIVDKKVTGGLKIGYGEINDVTVAIDYSTQDSCDFATISYSNAYCNKILPQMACFNGKINVTVETLRRQFCKVYSVSANKFDAILREYGGFTPEFLNDRDVFGALRAILHRTIIENAMEFFWTGDSALLQGGALGNAQPDGFLTQALVGDLVDPSDPLACAPGDNAATAIDWNVFAAGAGACSDTDAETVAGNTIKINGVTVTVPAELNLLALLRFIVIKNSSLSDKTKPVDWVLYVPAGGYACLDTALECYSRCCNVQYPSAEAASARELAFMRDRVLNLDGVTIRVKETKIDRWLLLPMSVNYYRQGGLVTEQSLQGLIYVDPDNIPWADDTITPSLEDWQQAFADGLQSAVIQQKMKCWDFGAEICLGFMAGNTQFWYSITNICCDAVC